MAQYLIDMEACCFRPVWTDMEAVGFLVGYLDAHDETPAEEQMTEGYKRSAGTSPYCWDVEGWELRDGALFSKEYEEAYDEISRTKAADGSDVIMFDYAMTAVIRDGKIVWLARLD